MKRKILNAIIILPVLTAMAFFAGCNYKSPDLFPDTAEDTFRLNGLTLTVADGSFYADSLVRGNTVSITAAAVNAANDTYTLTFSVKDGAGTLNASAYEAVWESPYKNSTYTIYITATDGNDTSSAVCSIDVTNSAPTIDQVIYSLTTSAGNSISVTVSDPDTVPETILSLSIAPDTGTVIPGSAEIHNSSGTGAFLWMPDGVTKGTTVSFEIVVVDDNPNTVTKTEQFYYE